MKIEMPKGLLANEWSRVWNEKRNAAVAEIVAASTSPLATSSPTGDDRESFDDWQMQWFFAEHHKPVEQRARVYATQSPDAHLYEAVTYCMHAARNDERRRIAAAIGNGLKVLLGAEFRDIFYDIAQQEDINIGYDS